MVAGYNRLLIASPVVIYRGSFTYLTQITGQVAVDTTGNASYSDLALINGAYLKLNDFSNWRLYMNALVNMSVYQSVFSVNHGYLNVGLYNLQISFASSNEVYQYLINVTECKF